MTDIEYHQYFERKRKETIDKIIGKNVNYPVHVEAGFSFNASKESLRKNKVVESPAHRKAMEYLAWYNEEYYRTNGKIVTYVEDKLDAEIPPPVK